MKISQPLAVTAQNIVRLLRIGDSTEASAQLNLFLVTIHQFLQTGTIPMAPAMIALQNALECMTRRDWVALADALEYQLAPLLPRT